MSPAPYVTTGNSKEKKNLRNSVSMVCVSLRLLKIINKRITCFKKSHLYVKVSSIDMHWI
jgi:hypothetical protein